jgi:hypothetical protein
LACSRQDTLVIRIGGAVPLPLPQPAALLLTFRTWAAGAPLVLKDTWIRAVCLSMLFLGLLLSMFDLGGVFCIVVFCTDSCAF